MSHGIPPFIEFADVALNRDKLARAHEVYRQCGMRGRDDAALMRRIDPGWDGKPY